MKLVYFVLLGSLMAAAHAFAADRLTDRDISDLVKRIEQGRDRFDDALDDRLKDSIVRGAAGEVNVARYLDDFQENIDRLEERLKPGYAASAETATLLRQASTIDRFFRQQPAGTSGISEWDRLTRDLKTLAAAYGADFPLADSATVRRFGDHELAESVEVIEGAAERLKRSLDSELKKDPTVEKAQRAAIVDEADTLSKEAKTLRNRVKNAKPSSAEADRLMARAAKLQTFIQSHRVPASASTWAAAASHMEIVSAAYRANSPAPR